MSYFARRTYFGQHVLCYLLLLIGNCHSSILRSKALQSEIISKFFTPRDLLKAGAVDKNWIGVEKVFKKITPKGGLFKNKQTKDVIFEGKTKSWYLHEIIKEFGKEFISTPQELMKEKQWNSLFSYLIKRVSRCHFWSENEEFLKALAEIANLHEGISLAIECKQIALLEILLQREFCGAKSLHCAAESNSVAIIDFLVNKGVKVDTTDGNFKTALMLATANANFDSVESLLRHGANPNMKDYKNRASLHHVATANKKRVNIIEILLKYGAKIDETDNTGRTPIMCVLDSKKYVLKSQKLASIKTLLDHKANPNIKDKYGKTALYRAVAQKEFDIAKILLNHGAASEEIYEISKELEVLPIGFRFYLYIRNILK